MMSILDQLAEMGTLKVTFSGGECLLHPDFIPILRHARQNDFSISVLSDLTLLNDEISCPTMRKTYRSYREVLDWAYSNGIKGYTDFIMMARTDSTMCVAANGEFYPCSGFLGYPLGNAHELSVSEVWHNSEALKRLRAVKWRDFPECLRCKAKPYCAMCMVRNMNETGSIFTVSKHFCDAAFLNMKIAKEYQAGLSPSCGSFRRSE